MISYVPSIRLRPWTFWFATDASPEHRGAAAAATPETVFRRTSRDTHRRRSARRLRPGLNGNAEAHLDQLLDDLRYGGHAFFVGADFARHSDS